MNKHGPWPRSHAACLLVAWSVCCSVSQISGETFGGRHTLQERLGHHNAPAPASETYVSVYSALHDPEAGEVRVFSEVHPKSACMAAAKCQLQGAGMDGRGWMGKELLVPAKAEMPFSALLDKDAPEPLECFHTCLLPPGSKGMQLASVTVVSNTGEVVLSQRVERIEVLGAQKRSVGICSAPIFTDVPQYLDWLDHHEALGVEGFHLYAVIMDLARARDVHGRGRPGHKKRLTVQQSHRVKWHTRHMTKYDMPTHYYGQLMLLNECLYRHRQMYEYLIFLDRDEFLHFVDTPPTAVNLAWEFHSRLADTLYTSLVFMTAVYRVRCLVETVHDLAEHSVHQGADSEAEPEFGEPMQVYKGYNIWDKDLRMPDFTNCTTERSTVGAGRQCHSKSVVRPLTVNFMATDYVWSPRDGYQAAPLPFLTNQAYIKHLRCLSDKHGWITDEAASLCERTSPVDYSVEAGHGDGVEVCPEDT
ncbi:hypothetical protein COCOBI_06-0680 [Coccomyxa sp. Obi]|nr:hypothetical protein COCOBI_06-0680 [Coccomyxa sp. Obi]